MDSSIEAGMWQARYAEKLCTAEEAVREIRSGRRILIGSGAAEPTLLVEAMVRSAPQLLDAEVVHLLTLGPAPYVAPEQKHRFRHTAFFIGNNVRDAVREGRADFLPVFLSDLPGLIRSKRIRVDVALVQVSVPDRHGYVSLGVSVDIVRAAVETAELVLAEVNPRMPRTLGDSFVHVRQLHKLIPVGTPLLELPVEPPDSVSEEIARNVAGLIENGSTLQLGIGKTPNAVLRALRNHSDLGIHTEMLSDGVMELADGGVITGKCKGLLPGKMVTSFLMGSQKLYGWAHEHPGLEMRASDFTNDPITISRNHRMVSVNSALAVDLTGQVAADTLNGYFFSGIGGQVDFVRGAARSPGGKAIIALPSTAKNGTVSRIQAAFEEGAGVVTTRGDVHHVVTEYGTADLWGKNVRERALSLMDVAHPDFRGELLAHAKARRYVFLDQVVPKANARWQSERTELLSDGAQFVVRPVKATDERAVQEMLYRLSDESVYRRFLTFKKAHPHEEIQELVDTDVEHNFALVACPTGSEEIAGIARYDVDAATRLGEVGLVVAQNWQGRGLGTVLFRCLGQVAEARGLAGFKMDVLMTNHPMLQLVQKSGWKLTSKRLDGIYHFQVDFRDP